MVARRLPTGGYQAVEEITLADGTRAYVQRVLSTRPDGSDALPGDASAANQTSGGQRTQIVGPDNSAVPVTGYDTNLVATTKAAQVRGHFYNYDTVAQAFVSTFGNGTGTFTIGKGGSSFVTAQTAVSTTAANVVAARAGRQKVTISLTTSVAYYVGPPGVTAATGLFVPAGASVTFDTASAIAVVLPTGTATATTADFF